MGKMARIEEMGKIKTTPYTPYPVPECPSPLSPSCISPFTLPNTLFWR
jgi:hypothetical protein